jgi:hypothetical protein
MLLRGLGLALLNECDQGRVGALLLAVAPEAIDANLDPGRADGDDRGVTGHFWLGLGGGRYQGDQEAWEETFHGVFLSSMTVGGLSGGN